MLIRAAALAAVVLVSVADAAPKKKRGKVVRVERSSRGGAVPVVCTGIRTDGVVTCYGRPPEVGVRAQVIDHEGAKATVRATAIKPMPDSCGNVSSWEISTDLERGDLAQISYTVGHAVVFDYRTTERSRFQQTGYGTAPVITPSNRQGETVMASIDDDGDDRPELVATWYSCDASAAVVPWGQGGHYCLVHYAREGASFVELRVDVVRNCF